MNDTYGYTDADGDVAAAQPIQQNGPTVWVQTTPDGCYIPVARLHEFINDLQSAAMDAAHAVKQDCHVTNCGPCSFDRAATSTT